MRAVVHEGGDEDSAGPLAVEHGGDLVGGGEFHQPVHGPGDAGAAEVSLCQLAMPRGWMVMVEVVAVVALAVLAAWRWSGRQERSCVPAVAGRDAKARRRRHTPVCQCGMSDQ